MSGIDGEQLLPSSVRKNALSSRGQVLVLKNVKTAILSDVIRRKAEFPRPAAFQRNYSK